MVAVYPVLIYTSLPQFTEDGRRGHSAPCLNIPFSPSVHSETCVNIPFSPSVHGGWSPWTAWSQCTLSCGGGSRQRVRLCESPSPSNGGRYCPGTDKQIDYCNREPCAGESRSINIYLTRDLILCTQHRTCNALSGHSLSLLLGGVPANPRYYSYGHRLHRHLSAGIGAAQISIT